MNTNKPVLVTTDGSPHSYNVLPHAAALAGALGGGIALVQVLGNEDAAAVEKELSSALARFGAQGSGLTNQRREGESVAGAILRCATTLDASVIALDSRGHGALRHILHGSVMQDLLKSANRPLLVSGPNAEQAPAASSPYRLLITNDGSAASATILKALAPLLTPGRFEVTLLRVHEHEPGGQDDAAALAECERSLDQARALLPFEVSVATQVRAIPRGAGVDTAIIEKAREVNAQAIGLSTHGVSASAHVFLGSVATTMLGRSPLPLLLARSEV